MATLVSIASAIVSWSSCIFGRLKCHQLAFEVPPVGALVQILETFPHVLKRDYGYRKHALQDEADVQRILWTILRSHYADLVDEEIGYPPKPGQVVVDLVL